MDDTNELPNLEWRALLQEVILEFDCEMLSEKALKAEALILERLRQLQQSNNGHQERTAISGCLPILRATRRERLKINKHRRN